MKRFSIVTLLAILFAAFGVSDATARTTAAGAFLNAPTAVIPMLDRNARLDMIDYYNSGSTTPTRNQLNGRSRITEMDSNTVTIEMTDATVYRIVLLPSKRLNDTVFAVIRTVKLPVHDSDIEVYSKDWGKYIHQDAFFEQPTLALWSKARSKKDKETFSQLAPFILSEYIYDDANRTLIVKNRMSEFLAPDDWEKLKPLLREQFVYKWSPRLGIFLRQNK